MFSRLSNKVAESKIPTIAGELSITISIGVAFSIRNTTVDQILRESDAALYKSKANGRNCISYANDL
jgi:PleD family two-component response regulator